MSWRNIALSGVFLAGCASDGGGGGAEGIPDNPGDVLKMSYFRAYPDSKNQQKLQPTYRVVQSYSWRDQVGESPKEPFPRGVAAEHLYQGFQPDAQIARLFRELKRMGVDQLKHRRPEEFNPEELIRSAKDPRQTSYTRVFTIGTDKWARSYYYPDHHIVTNEELSKRLIPIYTKCETFVLRACEFSVNVRTLSDPIVPKNR